MNTLFGIIVGSTYTGGVVKAAIRFHHTTRLPERKTVCYVSLYYDHLWEFERRAHSARELLELHQVQAEARVHKNDAFVKETGRKLSLTRALNSDAFTSMLDNIAAGVEPKDARKAIWHGYLTRFPTGLRHGM
jgi:ABC-type branched-subunit amino acid transport system ATPase component